ncbi:MAG: (d)CMP kinase [Pseudarcicella sp.]|nr:(d)CMP kinase [Pseudarcicella sp.]MBP6410728.1 (d)CMP kinase [Pseudarcicella sp.]
MKKIIIAVDGYSSCGKSSTAKIVAQKLGYVFIDTGAMYRAVCLYFYNNHIAITNPNEIEKALENIDITFHFNEHIGISETYLNGLNVENEIRKMHISEKVAEVSAIASVRKAMVMQQKRMGKNKGIVMDGRDIGTVVFPDAELKIFMTADIETRAGRRQKELLEKGEMYDLDEIITNLQKRDFIDTNREEGPLKQAIDAILLDTSSISLDQQVAFILELQKNNVEKKQ